MLIYNTIHRADIFHFHIVFILFSVHYHKNGSERGFPFRAAYYSPMRILIASMSNPTTYFPLSAKVTGMDVCPETEIRRR